VHVRFSQNSKNKVKCNPKTLGFNYLLLFSTQNKMKSKKYILITMSDDHCVGGSNPTVGRGCRSFGWDRIPEVPCRSGCGTIKVPPCSKALSAEHRPIWSPVTGNGDSRQIKCSWKIARAAINKQTNKQRKVSFLYFSQNWKNKTFKWN
jgi:hypothetical protein